MYFESGPAWVSWLRLLCQHTNPDTAPQTASALVMAWKHAQLACLRGVETTGRAQHRCDPAVTAGGQLWRSNPAVNSSGQLRQSTSAVNPGGQLRGSSRLSEQIRMGVGKVVPRLGLARKLVLPAWHDDRTPDLWVSEPLGARVSTIRQSGGLAINSCDPLWRSSRAVRSGGQLSPPAPKVTSVWPPGRPSEQNLRRH